MLKQYLEEELRYEAAQLEKINAFLEANPEVVLSYAKDCFYYYMKDANGADGY